MVSLETVFGRLPDSVRTSSLGGTSSGDSRCSHSRWDGALGLRSALLVAIEEVLATSSIGLDGFETDTAKCTILSSKPRQNVFPGGVLGSIDVLSASG